MTAMYLEALVAIAAAISVLMASAWVVQQRTGNSGWVDTIWTVSLGLVAIWSLRPGVHIAIRSAAHRARLARQFRFPSRRDRRVLRGGYGGETALWMKRWRWFATARLLGHAGGNGA
jgi:hypothetical protein